MISIINYLYEAEKKNNSTKLGLGEKIAGGTVIGLGAGTYGFGKVLNTGLKQIESNPDMKAEFRRMERKLNQDLMDQGKSPEEAEQITKQAMQMPAKIVSGMENVGLGAATAATGALAAHKLYKMYKNKKK